jgi:dTDP-4-amino-4,6-dideoxygalactose transaminase
MIGFNKPFFTGNEIKYITEAVEIEKLSGNGVFSKRCHDFFERRYGFKKVLLTHSCTAALEMAALLLDIGPGDEVILPSYTFVSTANAFLLRGATLRFADSCQENPNVDPDNIKKLITPKTKAIAVVHYAGVACDMEAILKVAEENNLFVVEDAAQAIDSFYKGKPLGSLGHLAAFSFHETKNIISGEGGMLVVNDERFKERAEIIWEKGTNRSAFFRGEVDKYTWVDIGSSFLPSELTAAFLFAQLENLDKIQTIRKFIWTKYFEGLQPLANKGLIRLPYIPEFATNNAHLFYLLLKDEEQRNEFLDYCKENGIQTIFHYLTLHNSPYFLSMKNSSDVILKQADHYAKTLVRLPFHPGLTEKNLDYIMEKTFKFFHQ